jgi:predicted Zn-dependent protease
MGKHFSAMNPPARLFFALISVLVLSACTTVPETGRRQLITTSAAEETQMGLAAFEEVKKETPVLNDATQQARIERIGRRIAAAVGRAMPDAQWEFVIFNDDTTVNAFALPGGKVGVYTGLIKLSASDDEIAAVIGHEIAHVTSRHGGERVSQAKLAQTIGAGVDAYAADKKYGQAAATIFGVGAQVGLLGYSRVQETEADIVGLRFAAGAGYDPRAAAAFWRKMQAKSGSKETFKWLSTHPPTAERIAKLEEIAPGLLPAYEEARARLR